MDSRTLEFYARELRFQRAMASDFAAAHLKIARRLGMQAGDIGDPYVERLVQASAFVNARTQMRFDDEFPRLTQALLSRVYPNYLSPTPSIAFARFYPGGKAGDLVAGHRIARGTLAASGLPDGGETACQFRLCHDVTLYPLEISRAKVGGVPPVIYGMDRFVPPHRRVRGALRLRIRTTDGVKIAHLQGLDQLPVCLAGDAKLASHLHELIHTASRRQRVRRAGALQRGRVHIPRRHFGCRDRGGAGPRRASCRSPHARFLATTSCMSISRARSGFTASSSLALRCCPRAAAVSLPWQGRCPNM